ncbi:hypothetical protein [Dyadobacter psychrotolerans]|uniref:Outer membrane protein beta-barrel domain-containing protein n=1 Tax=Dyadobacter psychrotolerans TaxID=2541721 RepID=A0A4R5E0U5_9BACT|nr:hypothetical protein [Dyadobacter psychrotolerans]TDE18201.1 hypothetical protein E0F88_01260 [Dyadobacter psychrotolerans]
MKKYFLIIAFSLTVFIASAQTQKWAIGFKIGEPTGVSLRKYGDRNGLDLTIGTYTGFLKNKKTYKSSKDDLGNIGLTFNGTYLWYVPFLNDRMMAYGGVGVQLNSRRYYPDRNINSVHTTNISTGPSATAGLEFFFANKPTSFFVEGGGYIELLPKIFYFNPNLNIGLRHNF